MKRLLLILLIMILATAAVIARGPQNAMGDHDTYLSSLPIEPLNGDERAALLYMIEEEKLARDVYLLLYDRWEVPTFSNIAASEQQHIDSVQSLVERYDLPIPRTMDTPGEFIDDELQALYHELVATGEASLTAAFTVGATIEDVDLADLHSELEKVDNEDITMIFNNLIAGSENHMRAFVGQIERQGESYVPQYIDASYYNAIIADAGSDGPRAQPRAASRASDRRSDAGRGQRSDRALSEGRGGDRQVRRGGGRW